MDRDRRNFIKLATGSLGVAPLLGAQAATESDGYDVIVIGGGFAGITAARETSLRGLRTLLLEARPRLGGRTLTLPLGGHDLDLGGTWVGWSQPHVWSEISRYGLAIDESAAARPERAVWFADGVRTEGSYDTYASMFERAAKAFYAPAREAFPRPFSPRFNTSQDRLDAVTAEAAIAELALSADERVMALSLAAINGHAPPSQSSYLDQLRWFALGDFDIWNMFDNLGRYRVRGGTGKLLERMHADSRAETRLGTVVQAIEQREDGVEVIDRSGERFRARVAIVCVPLNCLGDITFTPALAAAKREVSAARHTGSGVKIYARIAGRGKPIMCNGPHDMPLNFMWNEYQDDDSEILVGFGASQALLNLNDESAIANAVKAYLPNAKLLEFFTYDWNLDPYSRGTWCMYRPHVLSRHFSDLQSAEGHVYFAGADIANGWRGFIDGAIESGLGTARVVAERLHRPAV